MSEEALNPPAADIDRFQKKRGRAMSKPTSINKEFFDPKYLNYVYVTAGSAAL